jgi:hypothetical protein
MTFTLKDPGFTGFDVLFSDESFLSCCEAISPKIDENLEPRESTFLSTFLSIDSYKELLFNIFAKSKDPHTSP